MDIFTAGGTTAIETVDLGKPAPDPDGLIRVDFIALLPVPLTQGVSYEATVSSVGPGGSATSARSNTFGLSTPCSYTLSPTGKSFDAAGGTGSFSVTTAATCPWTAVSQASWVTVTAGASNTGPATVSYSVAPNTDTTIRSATVLTAGWNFTVQQAAAPAPSCTYAVSPGSATVPAPATTVSFTVSAAAGCAWTAASPASWAVISSGGSGNGAGTVTLSVLRNNSRWSRSATLTIAGRSIVLTQQGKPRR